MLQCSVAPSCVAQSVCRCMIFHVCSVACLRHPLWTMLRPVQPQPAHAAAMPCGMQHTASSSMPHATAPMLRPVQSPPCRLCSIHRPCGRASTGTTDHSQLRTQSVRTEAEEADKARSHEEAAPLVPPRCVQFSIERLDLPTPPRLGRPSKQPPRSVMARAPCSERQEPAPTQPTRRDGGARRRRTSSTEESARSYSERRTCIFQFWVVSRSCGEPFAPLWPPPRCVRACMQGAWW